MLDVDWLALVLGVLILVPSSIFVLHGVAILRRLIIVLVAALDVALVAAVVIAAITSTVSVALWVLVYMQFMCQYSKHRRYSTWLGCSVANAYVVMLFTIHLL